MRYNYWAVVIYFSVVLPDPGSQEYITTSLTTPPPSAPMFNSNKTELESMLPSRYSDNNPYGSNNWSASYNNNYYNSPYNQQQYPPPVVRIITFFVLIMLVLVLSSTFYNIFHDKWFRLNYCNKTTSVDPILKTKFSWEIRSVIVNRRILAKNKKIGNNKEKKYLKKFSDCLSF